MSQTKLISLDNLSRYDGKIKDLISSYKMAGNAIAYYECSTPNTEINITGAGHVVENTVKAENNTDLYMIRFTADAEATQTARTFNYAQNYPVLIVRRDLPINYSDGSDFTRTIHAWDYIIIKLVYDSNIMTGGVIVADHDSNIIKGESKTVDYASVITVNDAMPVNGDITVKIEPVQAGSGDPSPSNVRAISGWDACKVVTNLFDPTQTNAKNNIAIESDGTETSSVYWSLSEEVAVNGNTKYSVRYSTSNSGPYFAVAYYDQNHNFINIYEPTVESGRGYKIAQFVTPSNAKYIKLNIPKESQNYTQDWYSVTMGENNNYGNIYTISLNGTCYGGTLHIDNKGNAELVATHKSVDMGTLTWNYESSTNSMEAIINDMKTPASDYEKIDNVLPIAKTISAEERTSVSGCRSYVFKNLKNIFVRESGYTIASDFTTFVNGKIMVYELAAPITITLSPQSIQLLKGQNTIYANTGDIKLTYETGIEDSVANVQEQVNDVHRNFTDAIGWDNHKNLLKIYTLSEFKKNYSGFTWDGDNLVINGITMSFITDGSDNVNAIKFNGTLTGSYDLQIQVAKKIDPSILSGNILNGCPAGGSNNTYMLLVRIQGSTVDCTDIGNGATIPNITASNREVVVRIKVGTTVNNLTFYPMIRKASDTDPTFQPYHPVIGEAVNELITDLNTRVITDTPGYRIYRVSNVLTIAVDKSVSNSGGEGWVTIGTFDSVHAPSYSVYGYVFDNSAPGVALTMRAIRVYNNSNVGNIDIYLAANETVSARGSITYVK